MSIGLLSQSTNKKAKRGAARKVEYPFLRCYNAICKNRRPRKRWQEQMEEATVHQLPSRSRSRERSPLEEAARVSPPRLRDVNDVFGSASPPLSPSARLGRYRSRSRSQSRNESSSRSRSRSRSSQRVQNRRRSPSPRQPAQRTDGEEYGDMRHEARERGKQKIRTHGATSSFSKSSRLTDPAGSLDALVGAVDRAESTTKDLEKRVMGWESTQHVVHEAEVVEVELTDKLLKLHDLLDDETNAIVQGNIQAQVRRVREVGEVLRKVKETCIHGE
ncbi:hypothetical protein CYMTET_45701 [Cymbomonas tetramitiformis]|uniref:Uncharacterized protein n=1 Tax=Cymbomonas tetramitiformis TaxID=36881 RepID=A0AAE0BZJ1_9CHLO|nr:hypothetical protein CYMTET_45701 [Cymbomonas tetramitiformis]